MCFVEALRKTCKATYTHAHARTRAYANVQPQRRDTTHVAIIPTSVIIPASATGLTTNKYLRMSVYAHLCCMCRSSDLLTVHTAIGRYLQLNQGLCELRTVRVKLCMRNNVFFINCNRVPHTAPDNFVCAGYAANNQILVDHSIVMATFWVGAKQPL